jgi:hypothetical protein
MGNTVTDEDHPEIWKEGDVPKGSLHDNVKQRFESPGFDDEISAEIEMQIRGSRGLESLNVPLMFHWDHGGKEVILMTSMDDWKKQYRMIPDCGDFYAILEGPPGIHTYRFVVDGNWHCAPDQPYIKESEGCYSNYITVNRPSLESLDDVESNPFTQSLERGDRFSPLLQPPLIPAHFIAAMRDVDYFKHSEEVKHAIHVTSINHLFHTDIESAGGGSGAKVFSLTDRYEDKLYTTVYYTVPPEPTLQ